MQQNMPPHVAIRIVHDDEVELLMSLIQRAFAEYQGQLNPPSSAHTKTPAQLRAELADGAALVAAHHGEPVGCVLFHPRPDHVYLDRLSVLPHARGHGIGHALIAAVEQHTRVLGLDRIRLSVRLALADNHSFYRRLGYQDVSFGTHPGFQEPTFVTMERKLQANTIQISTLSLARPADKSAG
jgi:predicted N-acetyltransferase YhbS